MWRITTPQLLLDRNRLRIISDLLYGNQPSVRISESVTCKDIWSVFKRESVTYKDIWSAQGYLITRNAHMCTVRLLLSWYRQHTMQVKWGANYSSPFAVTNEERQRGVLSTLICWLRGWTLSQVEMHCGK